MRVSIVATSLDGQQPETKSVINMVHRIQNRNTGYSDFSNNNGSAQSFAFSNPNNSIITHGANALKLEDEVKSENLEASQTNETEISNFSSTPVEQTEHQNENIESTINPIEEKVEIETENFTSNGLENFQIEEEDSPNLFNSDDAENNENKLSSPEVTDDKEEDDLEIPAFLRRQKN